MAAAIAADRVFRALQEAHDGEAREEPVLPVVLLGAVLPGGSAPAAPGPRLRASAQSLAPRRGAHCRHPEVPGHRQHSGVHHQQRQDRLPAVAPAAEAVQRRAQVLRHLPPQPGGPGQVLLHQLQAGGNSRPPRPRPGAHPLPLHGLLERPPSPQRRRPQPPRPVSQRRPRRRRGLHEPRDVDEHLHVPLHAEEAPGQARQSRAGGAASQAQEEFRGRRVPPLPHVCARLRHRLRPRLVPRTIHAGEPRGAQPENASSQAVPPGASSVFLIDRHHHRHQQPASSRSAPRFMLSGSII
jgi:hypothetical protein